EQAVSVSLIRPDGLRSRRPRLEVAPRELTHPDVGHETLTDEQLVAPGICRTLEPAACCVLPFGFGRKLLPRRPSVRENVLVRDVNDRMPLSCFETARRTFGEAPLRTRYIPPPGQNVTEFDRAGRLREDRGAGNEAIRRDSRVHRRIERPLGDRDVAS